jgi:hypothetical protein
MSLQDEPGGSREGLPGLRSPEDAQRQPDHGLHRNGLISTTIRTTGEPHGLLRAAATQDSEQSESEGSLRARAQVVTFNNAVTEERYVTGLQKQVPSPHSEPLPPRHPEATRAPVTVEAISGTR